MQHRDSVPGDYVPGGIALLAKAGGSRPFDLFDAADVPQLCGAARLRPVPGLHHQAEALRLSDVALNFLMERRSKTMPDAEKVEMLNRVAAMAAALNAFMCRSDLANLFDPDIGHLPSIQLAMGVSSADAEWWERKDAARQVAYLIGGDPDPRRFLWILEAAASEQARRDMGPVRRGPPPKTTRHEFVGGVLRVYAVMTGRKPRIGVESGGTRRRGPAARYLAEVCRLMRERLTDGERRADPEIGALLAKGEVETTAGQWVAEALRYEANAGRRWAASLAATDKNKLS